MLTPIFTIEQTSECLIIKIYAPQANVRDVEADYCDRQFYFSARPYFLKIYLPGELSDIEQISCTYDCNNGCYTYRAPKKNINEFFPNLDLINELLKPSEIHAKRLVEENGIDNDIVADILNEPQIPQTSDADDTVDEKCRLYGYGFAWSRHGIIGKFSAEIGELLELNDPDNSLIEKRTFDCLRHDQMKFDIDHYLVDLYEVNPLLDECLQLEYPTTCFDLSFESRDHLKDLPRRNFPKYSWDLQKMIALSLADILFAYLYDMRTTNAEHCCESGWTITKLSPTLSSFVRWRTAKECLAGAVRKSLCYPLYRHWDLSMKVVDDLKLLLSKGKVSLLQCLVDVRTILSTSGDFRYLLNDLYITDYCLWIQHVEDAILLWLQDEFNDLMLTKNEMGLDLEEIEMESSLRLLKVTDENVDPSDSDDDHPSS